MKLLLIEDEKELSETLVQILTKNKYGVDAVYDGEDGLNYALTGMSREPQVTVLNNLLSGFISIGAISVIRQIILVGFMQNKAN